MRTKNLVMLQQEFVNFIQSKKNLSPDIKTGFSNIDDTLSDLKRGNLTLIAGREEWAKQILPSPS